MADITLIIGNQNYSSWSLRPYLALRHAGAGFELVVIPLHQPDTRERILRYSPAGRVPVLRHGEITIWDSLAICEYLAEAFPEAKLWPTDRAARAVARAVSAEMHGGFGALRDALPMNVRALKPGRAAIDAGAASDIDRIKVIWRDCRRRYGARDRFLFGAFSNADAMFGPVVSRFRTYGIALDGEEAAYADAVWSLPQMMEWADGARREPWAMPRFDAM